jgi:16S rRNA (guanine966-N2)-methyltransferase
MRITGGEWRSRVLQVPTDKNVTRPTMDQTRQAVFNILLNAAWALKDNGQPLLIGATIVDVFSGTGAMALEALSRGAEQASCIDKDPQSIAIIQKNATTLQCMGQVKIIRADALHIAAATGQAAHICFIDPPYADDTWPDVLRRLQQQGWINTETLIVLETSSKQTRETNAMAEDIMELYDQRRYGHALISFGSLKTDS